MKTKCAYCNEDIEIPGDSSYYDLSYDYRNIIGNPITHCNKCGHDFIDDKKAEWIIMTPIERQRYFECYNPTKFLVPTIISFIFAFLILPAIVGLVCLSIYLTRKAIYNDHLYDKRIVDSLTRCMDEAYFNKLVKCGATFYEIEEHEEKVNSVNPKINIMIKRANNINYRIIYDNLSNNVTWKK